MSKIPLKPLTPDPSRKSPGFSVCDIEASDWIKFLVIGLAFKKYDNDGLFQSQRYEYFENIAEFCDVIFEEEQPHNIIFAHFGGKYDFNFLIKEFHCRYESFFIHDIIPRGSGLLSMKVSTFERRDVAPKREDDLIAKTKDGFYLVKVRTIEFRDCSAMLPFSLASLTENFGVEHKKQEIDYEAITKVTPELLEYLEYDCWGLYECIEKYFNWPIIKQAGPAMTIASQSLKVFRTFMKNPIPALSGRVEEFVRSSYFGGRTEVFKPFFEQCEDNKLLRSYDVNSLYPAVMRTHEFPTQFKFETQFYLENQMGFYDVEVKVPDMYVPPLGTRYEGMEGKLIFPTGTFRGVWSTLELNYAMEMGAKILKVYRGAVFDSGGFIFKNYVDHLYDLRKKSKKDSVDNVLCKLLMNSTYGRFGLNLNREQLEFDYGQLGVTPYMDIPMSDDGKRVIRLAKKDVQLDSSFSNVAIAAWVTSASRVWMHKLYSKAPEDLYYTDTDSVKTTYKYAENDSDLGELKYEYGSKRACFILPKTYMEDTTRPIFKMFNESGREIKDMKSSKKIVMKGFDKKKISSFTMDDFKSSLEGDMRRLQSMNPRKFATLKTAIRRDAFLVLLNEAPRQIRTRYNKRRIYKRAWSQVFDTEPLHLKDGTVSNLAKNALKKWRRPTIQEMQEIERRVILSNPELQEFDLL